jgi:hypothetical protein
MVFPSSPLQKSSHGFSSPSVFQEENQSHNSSLISFAVIIIPWFLIPKKIKRQPNIWNHSRTEMESTDFVSLLRIYATANRKNFQRKRKRSTARAGTSRKEENESPWLDPGPKIQISKYVSSADDVYLSQIWDLVSPKFRALKKHWPPVSITRNYFPPKIWTRGCMTKRGGAWQKSVWEPWVGSLGLVSL